MAEHKKNNLILEHHFDRKTKRHYLNGHLTVLHCHHYSSLYAQLAIDSDETELLQQSSEDTFYELLNDYFDKHEPATLPEKIDIACQYFAAVGLGMMKVNYFGEDSGEVELLSSHVDSGWIKKWNRHDGPVNFMGAGYISAMFSSILSEPTKTFRVSEAQSIVMGADTSLFTVVRS